MSSPNFIFTSLGNIDLYTIIFRNNITLPKARVYGVLNTIEKMSLRRTVTVLARSD